MASVLSPFQQHREKIRLLQDKKTSLVEAPQSLHILNAELEQDVNHVRTQFSSIAERVEYKRTVLLPKWQPKAEQYLQEGKVYQNVIFVYCIIWLFDIEQFDTAIDWAIIAAEQNQETPSNFKSRLPAFVADNVLDWAEKASANGHSIEPYFSKVFELIQHKWRLHEELCAKWYKFAGLYLLRDENGTPRATAIDSIETLQNAKKLLEQAHAFYDKIGVKTMIGSIDARISALSK